MECGVLPLKQLPKMEVVVNMDSRWSLNSKSSSSCWFSHPGILHLRKHCVQMYECGWVCTHAMVCVCVEVRATWGSPFSPTNWAKTVNSGLVARPFTHWAILVAGSPSPTSDIKQDWKYYHSRTWAAPQARTHVRLPLCCLHVLSTRITSVPHTWLRQGHCVPRCLLCGMSEMQWPVKLVL